MSMERTKRLLSSVFAMGLALFARQSVAQNLVARAQLRRTVDPSPRAAYGSVLMSIDANGKETFQVNVSDLGEENYGPFIRGESIITTDIVFTLHLAPLDQTSFNHGDWTRTLLGEGQAPLDFLSAFGSLQDLNGNIAIVAQPGIPFVTTVFTNIVGGVTNISLGVTNVVGSTTNIINGIVIPNPGQTGEVFGVLWAPLAELTANPSLLNYHREGDLVAVGDASPHARGTVKISFTGSTGRSQFDVEAVNLTSGQQYTLYVANSTNQTNTVMIAVDTMTQDDFGHTARLVRDTQFADPLPQQVRNVGDLSGHLIQVLDEFKTVHLQGVIP
jgi:hypothetical protein